MRLQRQLSRKIGGKQYDKWVITIPPKDIEKLKWKEGENLKSFITNSESLLISKSTEMTYDEFKSGVNSLLTREVKGLTWETIKQMMHFPQKVPNNLWVKKLEKEIGLNRIKDDGKTYWYLDHKDCIIFTIGYEKRTPEEFIKVLKENRIEQLVDVRELAFSRKNGFSKSVLNNLLRENGIVYKHFPSLGAPREVRYDLWKKWDYEKFFKEYSDALARPDSQEHLKDLEGLAKVRRTAIMCFERNVEVCHRKIIKENLIRSGCRVIDL